METINIANVKVNSGALEADITNLLLKRVNIFVGANNSGKSRLIRTIIDKNKVEYEYQYDELFCNISKLLEIYKEIKEQQINRAKGGNYNALLKDIAYLESIKGIIINTTLTNLIAESYKHCVNSASESRLTWKDGKRQELVRLKDEIIQFLKKREKDIISRDLYYIPTLRGLRTLDFLDRAKHEIDDAFIKAQLGRDISFNKDFYKGKTLKDYWGEDKDIVSGNNFGYTHFEQTIGINVFTGLDLFQELTDMMLGSHSERLLIQQWCKFLETNYFEETIDITPNIKEGVVKIKLGNQPDRSIHNLGDGLQSIIIITFIMFKCKNTNTLLAIEEPELFLHPGMQRILVENMLNEEFSNIQYLITTHSSHFLEILYENKDLVNIYNCKRIKEKITLDNILNTDEGTILTNLGIKASSVFLSNAIIMVEGISDIIYFRKFLKLYMEIEGIKKFIEDKHFTFIESAGNNIVHWDFLDGDINSRRIFKNVFVIVDGDGINIDKVINTENQLNDKEKRLKKINELDFSYVLRCRETENLLPWYAIKKYIIKKESTYGGKNRIINESKIIDLDENQNSYRKNHMGRLIQKNLEPLKNSLENCKVYKYETDSKTVANKLEFSKGVSNYLNDFNHLSEESKTLTIKLYNFIKDINK